MRGVLAETPEKYCCYCGKKLERKRFKKRNRLEDLEVFKRRKYCNSECMKKGFVKSGIHEEQTFRSAHASARKLYLSKFEIKECFLCGSEKSLDVHHKNENWHDNRIENLVVLCRSCHMKEHRKASICKVERCEGKVKGLGFCEKHYQRYKRYGDPLIVRWNTKHTKYEMKEDYSK